MITAAQAHKFQQESKITHVLARQLEYIYTMIEGKARLGNNKFVWLVGEEFTKDDIQYLVEAVRDRGFEVQRNDRNFYTIFW